MQAVKLLPSLVEPTPISDDFVQGIACIERVGSCARFVLFAEQTILEAGCPARVVVRKIIIPMDALPAAVCHAAEFLGMRVINAVGNVFKLPRR